MTSTISQEQFGSGSATGEGAVGRAVAQAVAAVGARGSSLVLVFPGAELSPDVTVDEAARAAGRVPVVGITGNGQISTSGPLLGGCTALALDAAMAVGIGLRGGASANLRAAGFEATREAMAQVDADAGHAVVLLFLDPDSGDNADAVAGAYDVAGPHVPLAGGGAGGGRPTLYAQGEAHRDALLAIALVSPTPIGLGLSHGCRPVGVPAIVTRTAGRTILDLDGRPAEQVYLEKMGHAGEALSDREFEALAVTHPLGQPELSGDVRLRHVRGRARDGGLDCATRISENAAVEVAEESPERIVESGYRAMRVATAPLERVRGALVFDCAGRKRAVGPGLAQAVDRMTSCVPDTVPVVGAYTHGEIARIRGAMGDRNHAIVVVAFG
jgi:hypothetical protein